MTSLASKKCVACEVGGKPLTRLEAETLLKEIPDWMLADDVKKISREFKFKDFKSAFNFASKIADLAEEEGHHPDLEIGWGRVRVNLTTHAVKGLSENDFILAAKIGKLKA